MEAQYSDPPMYKEVWPRKHVRIDDSQMNYSYLYSCFSTLYVLTVDVEVGQIVSADRCQIPFVSGLRHLIRHSLLFSQCVLNFTVSRIIQEAVCCYSVSICWFWRKFKASYMCKVVLCAICIRPRKFALSTVLSVRPCATRAVKTGDKDASVLFDCLSFPPFLCLETHCYDQLGRLVCDHWVHREPPAFLVVPFQVRKFASPVKRAESTDPNV